MSVVEFVIVAILWFGKFQGKYNAERERERVRVRERENPSS
jgi:hypothetical protein